MMGRTGAGVAFAASLGLVVAALGAWASADGAAVGGDLPRAAALSGVSATTDGPAVAPRGPAPAPAAGTTAVERSGAGGLPASAEVPRTDATRIATPAEAEPPVRVRIPGSGIDMPIVATGVQRDGQMELPEDPRRIGWYRFGALPGDDRGSAVLGGHVDSTRYGVGPLAGLAGVEPGARIVVTGADGERHRYRVTSVERISKAALPTDRLFDPDVEHRLVVITCGGRYLPEAGGYEDNIVVIAKPVR